jgi:hypothetical protein
MTAINLHEMLWPSMKFHDYYKLAMRCYAIYEIADECNNPKNACAWYSCHVQEGGVQTRCVRRNVL